MNNATKMIKLILAGTALASLATATLCFAGYMDGHK